MLKILLKKQIMEIFRMYFYDEKKNKARSKASTIGFIVLFVFLMAGMLGGIFTFLAVSMCGALVSAGADWLYFLFFGAVAVLLGAFGSIFNTFSGLYLSKDNDLLLSMPIPVKDIIASRLMSVYLMGLMYSSVVTVPAVIVYWIKARTDVLSVICNILFIAKISAVILILSCALGYVVARVSVKLKRKSYITVLTSLAFFGLYYFVCFKAQSFISYLINNAAVLSDKIKTMSFSAYALGEAFAGNILYMLVASLILAAVIALTIFLISKSFVKTAVLSSEQSRVKHKEKSEKKKSLDSALFCKELRRFTSSANYMLNCGMGCLVLIIAGVAFIIKGDSILSFFDHQFGGFLSPKVMLCAAVCVMCAMNDITAPSVSLEGKSLWIYQSLPVDAFDVLKAKVYVQTVLTGIPALFCSVCACIIAEMNALEWIMTFITVLVSILFFSEFGLILGLKMPNLNWTNEISPIKQGLPPMISVFGGMIFAILIAVGDLIMNGVIPDWAYLAVFALIFFILSALMYAWIKKKGTRIFREL